jgi:biopolymer transport protein ExbB/biopolymer transport protein TolQ
MYLLLGLSVVSVAAMVERVVFFRRHKDDIHRLTRQFHDAMANDDVFEADALLAKSPSIEARVLRAGFRWLDGGADVVMEVIGSEMEKVRREMESGMTMLGTLGNNAPFVGLLGTVIGVIEAFHQLSDASNKGAMNNVMAGIAEALVATGVGLFVAIPAVVAYNIAQKKISDIESNVTSMAKLLAAIIKFREKDEGAMPRALDDDGEPAAAPIQHSHVEIEIERDEAVKAVSAPESAAGLQETPWQPLSRPAAASAAASLASTSRRWSTWCSCSWSS